MSLELDSVPVAGVVTGPGPATAARAGVAGVRAAAQPVLERIAAGARGREGTRDHPYAEVRALAAAGVTLVGVPLADGGAGGTLRDVVEVVVDIARADSNVAQALRSTFLTARGASSRGDHPDRERTLARLRAGDLFAGTTNERGGRSGGIATRLTLRDGELRLTGEKYYSTGGLHARWFSGTAVDDAGSVVRFTIPVDRAGVTLLDDFDAVGQRLTASGTTRFEDVLARPDEVSRVDDAAPPHPWQGSFAQLYLAAVEAGIAAAARDDAVWFARERARSIKHSTAERAVDDPYVRHVVGEIAARAAAARAVVLVAAETLDGVQEAEPDAQRAASSGAAVAVAQAQFVAVEQALRASELLFDVGGGSATDRDHALDRHWRNARTVANHNPRAWKAAVAGAYHLVGEEPPTTGLF